MAEGSRADNEVQPREEPCRRLRNRCHTNALHIQDELVVAGMPQSRTLSYYGAVAAGQRFIENMNGIAVRLSCCRSLLTLTKRRSNPGIKASLCLPLCSTDIPLSPSCQVLSLIMAFKALTAILALALSFTAVNGEYQVVTFHDILSSHLQCRCHRSTRHLPRWQHREQRCMLSFVRHPGRYSN